MTDWPAFMRAICDDPENDVPRMVAADYLQEQGDEARADFIRVQCALAEVDKRIADPKPLPVFGIDIHKRRDALCRREREIVMQMGSGSIPKFVSGRGAHGYDANRLEWSLGGSMIGVLRRGFIATIRTTAADWIAHGQEILRQQPVERVELTDGQPLTIKPIALFWTLKYGEGVTSDIKWYQNRAELIDAMPATLRSWGIGRLVSTITHVDDAVTAGLMALTHSDRPRGTGR